MTFGGMKRILTQITKRTNPIGKMWEMWTTLKRRISAGQKIPLRK